MSKPIAKITKEHHFDNLINNLPLFTILYATQCLMAHFIFSEIVNPSLFAIVLGATLITLLSTIYVYYRYHHIIVFEDRIHIYFEPLNISKIIQISSIKKIEAPLEECEFASIYITLQNDELIGLHFIDYPLQVKNFLSQIIEQYHQPQDQELDKAA